MSRRYSETLQSPPALARFILTAIVGLALDLWTKNLAVDRLRGGRTVEFIPNWLSFEFIKNPGAVFGIARAKRDSSSSYRCWRSRF